MTDNEIKILIENLDANDFNLLIEEMRQNDPWCCRETTNPDIWNFANTLDENFDLDIEEELNEAKNLLINFALYNGDIIDNDLENFNDTFWIIFTEFDYKRKNK